ncbi:Acetyltransferase (GNAT) family protein [Sulfobacillus thermosulfidooxidans DSM 9293]|uniref:Acetyltransferase (GNAT) family protein n=1 Tax=Sulfobacillus thermosulfidooxidans (strain DSM 9293 / VKM B-1269 / AT-1) TaxID=929705 RepID=A0A1W1WHB1_SULTA|nr:GNAT family N-acetyltransferase [Sulfobacillus thermosulfidooxidans]SMC05704.1 Acetyltransferase (GNAT) family protein [Sulfobacillus thermosulfidooxidans DSM 9293]
MQTFARMKDSFIVSTDPALLDKETIFSYLHHEAYWSLGLPRDVFEKSLEHSLCFGIYQHNTQLGFARVISDFSTFAYLCDVFILTPYRGQGLGKWLMESIMDHPDLQGLRRFYLVTRDAHGLYKHYGFSSLDDCGRHMEKVVPAKVLYERGQNQE